MIAEPGKTYAQVVSGKVHWLFNSTMLPEWADSAFTAVDVTATNPQPQVGWSYNGSVFAPPPPPTAEEAAEAARKQSISDDVLRQQLRNALMTSNNTQISAFVDAQVTDIASARLMFKRVLLLIAGVY